MLDGRGMAAWSSLVGKNNFGYDWSGKVRWEWKGIDSKADEPGELGGHLVSPRS